MEGELQVLKNALEWMATIGSGVAGFYLIEKVFNRWPWVQKMEKDVKFWFSMAVVGILAEASYLAQVVMLYAAQPPDWRTWVEMSYFHIAGAIITATGMHNQLVRRRQR